MMTLALNDAEEKTEDEDHPEMPSKKVLEKELEKSNQLEPDDEETQAAMQKVVEILKDMGPAPPPKAVANADFDVIIVGAGCSGVGTALMLTETFGLKKERVLLVERGPEVG